MNHLSYVLNRRHEFTLALYSLETDWFIAQSFSLSMIIWDCKRGRESSASPARAANITVSLTVTRQNKHCVRTAVTGRGSVLTGHHGSIWRVVPDECCPSLVNVMVGDTFHRLAWLLGAPPRGRCAVRSHLQAFGSLLTKTIGGIGHWQEDIRVIPQIVGQKNLSVLHGVGKLRGTFAVVWVSRVCTIWKLGLFLEDSYE